jgi:hypothetical protein
LLVERDAALAREQSLQEVSDEAGHGIGLTDEELKTARSDAVAQDVANKRAEVGSALILILIST